MDSPMPTGEIKALTSLRGVAAMMVVLQHFSTTMQMHSAVPIPSLVPHGYVAVDLFFVLSGFIMAYTYLAGFQARRLREYPDFLLKRVARVVPLNTAAVLLVLLGGVVSQALLARNIIYPFAATPYDAVCNLLMLQGLGIGQNLNPPSWSISTEFVAYLVFPVLLVVVFARQRVLLALAVAVSLIALTVSALSHARLGLDTYTHAGGLNRCFAEFTLGLATYRVVTLPAVRRAVASDRIATGAILLSLVLLLLRYDLLIVLSVPLLIAALACNRGRVSRVMASRLPYFLGVISYSIYLLHAPLRQVWLEAVQVVHPTALSGPAAMLLALLGSFAILPVAWAGYVLVERPGRGVIRALARRMAPRGAAGGTARPAPPR